MPAKGVNGTNFGKRKRLQLLRQLRLARSILAGDDFLAQRPAHFVAHLRRRLIGKGNGKHVLHACAARTDKLDKPPYHHRRLAAARRRGHDDPPLLLYGFALFVRQSHCQPPFLSRTIFTTSLQLTSRSFLHSPVNPQSESSLQYSHDFS